MTLTSFSRALIIGVVLTFTIVASLFILGKYELVSAWHNGAVHPNNFEPTSPDYAQSGYKVGDWCPGAQNATPGPCPGYAQAGYGTTNPGDVLNTYKQSSYYAQASYDTSGTVGINVGPGDPDYWTQEMMDNAGTLDMGVVVTGYEEIGGESDDNSDAFVIGGALPGGAPWYSPGCTMEALICPDGSAVGRTGPNCEFSACPSGSPMPPILFGDNLVGYWQFEETSGNSVLDSTENNNDGTLENGATRFVSPQNGRKLELDGVNDRVAVTAGASLKSLGEISILAWIRPTENSGAVVLKGATVPHRFQTGIADDGKLYFRAGYSTTPGAWRSDAILPLNSWSHVAVTYSFSSTNNDPVLYIGGVAVPMTELQAPAGTPIADDGNLYFGNNTDTGAGLTAGFAGRADEIRIYNKALSATNVQAIRNGVSTLVPLPNPAPISFGISDIESVSYRSVDPIPMAIDDEYAEYTIELKTGDTVIIKVAFFAPPGTLEIQLKKHGYTGTLADFLKLVNDEEVTPPPQKPTTFFGKIAAAFKNAFSKTVSFFFGDNAKKVTDREFADLPVSGTADYQSGTRGLDDIEAFVINSLKRHSTEYCPDDYPFEAYVITAKPPEIGMYGCAKTGDIGSYLQEIARELNNKHGFELMALVDLLKKPIYSGEADEAADDLLEDVDYDVPGVGINTVGLEVKVKSGTGAIIHDWVKGNVNIGPQDELAFRWDAALYTQCLPFLADNGNYSLTRGDDTKMLSGNTETEGFNIFERTGLYYIECSGKNGSEMVDIGSIFVTISDNKEDHGVDLGTGEHVTVAIDETSPLKVTVTYTDNSDADGCGPNYVGEINWGDGTITNEPEVAIMLCKIGKSVSASHTYAKAQAYQITVKRAGQLKHRETVNLAGTAGSGFSASPTSGNAPLNVKFSLNTKKVSKIEFGDGASQSFSCGQVQGASITDLGSTQVAQLVCTAPGCGAGDYNQSSYYSESQYAVTHFGGTPVPIGGGNQDDKPPLVLSGPLGVLSGSSGSTDANTPALCGQKKISHTYQTSGTYTAKAKTSEGDKTITITVGSGNGGELSANPHSGKAPLTVSFTYKHKGTATLSFGDRTPSVTSSCSAIRTGATDEECTVTRSHTYEAAGKYQAKLVTGCLSTESCGVRSEPVVSSVEINVISDKPSYPASPDDKSCAITGPGQDCIPANDLKPSQPNNPFWCIASWLPGCADGGDHHDPDPGGGSPGGGGGNPGPANDYGQGGYMSDRDPGDQTGYTSDD